MYKLVKSALMASAVLSSFASAGHAADVKSVEMLHWWTSGGEAAGVREIQSALAKKGVTWKDAAVAGGTGSNAYQVLRARVAAGTAPAGAQMHIQETLNWENEGLLRNFDEISTKDGWSKSIMPSLLPYIQKDGHFFAVPVSMHRSNWLWYNVSLLKKVNAEPPKTWDDFNAVATKLKAAGIVPLALGGQDWQYADLLESVMLGVGGPDFYRKAIVDGDTETLKSGTMIKVFDQIAKMRNFVDPNSPGRDWNLATAMLIKNEAAMQIMGDWAKAEFAVAGKAEGTDYGCVASPGTGGSYLWLVDNFAFFKPKNDAEKAAQDTLAETVLDPTVQVDFAVKKGSIPVIVAADSGKLDACGKKAFDDRAEAQKTNEVLPSFAHNAAMPAAKTGVFLDVVSQFFTTPSMTSQQAVDQLVAGLSQVQ